MELRHLHHLKILAETGSFHRAARRIGLRQPALSQSIRSLEAEVGVKLVLRTHSGSHLTQAGHVFLTKAARILADLDSAVLLARSEANQGAGLLRLGIAPDAITGHFVRAIHAFSEIHRNVIIVSDGSSSRLLSMIDDEQLDLTLMPLPFPRDHISCEPMWREDLHIVLSDTHRLTAETAIDICKLYDELIIVEPRSPAAGTAAVFLSAFQAAGIEPRLTTALLHQETRLALVAAGLGVAVQLASVQHFSGVTGLVTRPLMPPLTITIAAAWPKSGMTLLAQQFIQFVRLLSV